MLVAGAPPGGLGELGQFGGVHDVVVGDVPKEGEHPPLVGVRGLPRDDPNRDPLSFRFFRHHDLTLPVEVEDRRVEPVVVELEGVAFEEEVHLPGFECGIRRETQILGHRKRFLSAVAEVDAKEDERHRKDKDCRKAVEDAGRPVEDRRPAVGVGRLLPHVRDKRRETVDSLHEPAVEDQLDVQRVVLRGAPRDDDGFRRPFDIEGRGIRGDFFDHPFDGQGRRMRVDLLDIPAERQGDPEVPEGNMLVHEFQVQVRPLVVVLDRRPDPVAVLNRVGARVEVVGVVEAHFVCKRKALDSREIGGTRGPGGRPHLAPRVLDVADGPGRGGHPDKLDVRLVNGGKSERRIPVAKEHPVLPGRPDKVGITLDQGPVFVKDGIVVLNLQVLPE